MKVFVIPPQILGYYLYLTLPLYWKMVEVASVAAAGCFACSLRCTEEMHTFSLRDIQISLLIPRSHLYWGKKPVDVMLIDLVWMEAGSLFSIPQLLPTECFSLISPLLSPH